MDAHTNDGARDAKKEVTATFYSFVFFILLPYFLSRNTRAYIVDSVVCLNLSEHIYYNGA